MHAEQQSRLLELHGYLDESGPKLAYLKTHHPHKHRHVMQILRALNRAVNLENHVLETTLAEQRS